MASPNDVLRIKGGTFAGFEAVVLSVDEYEATVAVEIFGGATTLHFPLAQVSELLEPFGDVPPQATVDEPAALIDELREHHPGADAIYATHWQGFPVCGSVQLSSGSHSVNLVVRELNFTSPLTSDNRQIKTVKSVVIKPDIWNQFSQLIEESDFWSLAHDNGRRFTTRQKALHYHLEGWDGSHYHSVIQRTLDTSPIEKACRFLANLAPDIQ